MNHVMVTALGVVWFSVTPETAKNPVPEFYSVSQIGSVQPAGWRRSKPVQDACPVYDDAGNVIGASLACSNRTRK